MFNKYWFKPKKYGYGAEPSSLEGWALIILYAIIVIYVSIYYVYDIFFYLAFLFLITFLLIQISIIKTEGKWGWKWGK